MSDFVTKEKNTYQNHIIKEHPELKTECFSKLQVKIELGIESDIEMDVQSANDQNFASSINHELKLKEDILKPGEIKLNSSESK